MKACPNGQYSNLSNIEAILTARVVVAAFNSSKSNLHLTLNSSAPRLD